MDHGFAESGMVEGSVVLKRKASTTLHVGVVDVAFRMQDFLTFRFYSCRYLFGFCRGSRFIVGGDHFDGCWLSEQCSNLTGKIEAGSASNFFF